MHNLRRSFLKATGLAGLIAFLNPTKLMDKQKNSSKNSDDKNKELLNFQSIQTDTTDEITLPQGFNYNVVCAWGDKLFPHSPNFSYGENTSDAQLLQIGENHDGMSFFHVEKHIKDVNLNANIDHIGILAINHEYNNYEYLFSVGKNYPGKDYLQEWTAEKVKKAQASLGVSIVGIEHNKTTNMWEVNLNSPYNKRYHLSSEMKFSGIAAGSKYLQNTYDKTGHKTKGTFANCANGKTPWGTYLTCEENFSGYFTTDNQEFIPNQIQKRYGVTKEGYKVNWHKFDERFDIAKNPNDFHSFGWVVEIDPYDKNFIPIKHTALGRFKHENIAIQQAQEGKPLIAYMGDDEQGEYIYKYISKNVYKEKDGKKNSLLLTEGTLFAAKFTANNQGEWIPLVYDERYINNPDNLYIKSQEDIQIFTRFAADLVSATDMDRPEWITINRITKHAYVSLTNNTSRKKINLANPRPQNKFGHIVRWKDDLEHISYGMHKFNWDIFLLAGNIEQGGSQDKILFNSPDCLAFDNQGRLWIATDGNISNTGEFANHGNNQLLCVDTDTHEIKRFMVGVKGCEISGICFDNNYQTLFLNIQHPGESDAYAFSLPVSPGQSQNDFIARNPFYISSWPRNKKNTTAKTPRSASIAVDITNL